MATVNLGRVVGKSAYEVWLDAGNTGTEADYLESLKGEITTAQMNTAISNALVPVTSQLADIADNAALWRTATGNPATIYPVPKSRLYPRIELVATQEGEGDPSPENIRPIIPSVVAGGKVKARRTGKNLISYDTARNKPNDIFLYETIGFLVTAGVTYTLSFPFISGNMNEITVRKISDGSILSRLYTQPKLTFTPSETMLVSFYGYYDGMPATGRNAQLELGSTATPYEPYSGESYDLLTAEQDFYGLPDAPVVVDAEAGTVTVQDAVVVLDGSADEDWNVQNNGTPNQRYLLPATNKKSSVAGMCSHYTNASVNSGTTNIGVSFLDSSIAVQFRPDLTAYPNISAWKAYLAAQYAAGTPVVIQYQRATPITIPITPPVIAALERLKRTEARQNVLTVTANDSTVGVQKQTVTYQKSPIRESDEIAAAIAAFV